MKENKELANLYTDVPMVQKINAFMALSAILITVIIPFIFPIEPESIKVIIIVGVVTTLFTVIYYSIPKLYTNRSILLVSDLVYIIAISFVMLNLGEWGFFYVIFFSLIIAIDAFTYTKKEFFSALSFISIAIVSVNYLQIGGHHIGDFTDFYFTTIFQLYWILSLAILLRVFAKQALNLKQKKEAVEATLLIIEKEKQEILTLFNSLSDSILAVNFKNKITFINQEASATLTLGKNLIGKDIDGEIKYLANDKVKSIKDLIKGEKVYLNDIKIKNDTGFKRFNLSITPISNIDGGYEGSIIYLHSLSEEEELEKTKVEFASIASHELRTPLAVIEGYAHLLLENKKVSKDVEISNYLKTIHSTCEDLIDLSNNILTITKLESKAIKYTPKEADLNEVLESLVKIYTKKAQEKKIKLNYSNKKLPIIKTDQSKIKEIVANLIDNALKFTEKGSVTIEATKNAKEIIISVIDTGLGIKKESQPKIFKKFFRAEDWKTRKTGGTGLGLYISDSLAKIIGAKIVLESTENVGSKFSIYIPIK